MTDWTKVKRVCARCGKKFTTRSDTPNRQKFCTKKCGALGRTKVVKSGGYHWSEYK